MVPPFIALTRSVTGGYPPQRLLKAGNVGELNFHVKLGLETLQSGAGRHPLGRPAWGCRHVDATFQTTTLITSWRRLAVGFAPVLQLLGRPASVWPISASDLAEALHWSCVVSKEVRSWNTCELGLPCGSLDGC